MADIVDLLRKMAAGDAALTRGAMGAAVTEIVRLRTEIAQARDVLGFGWLAGGVSLAEGIHMKTRHLERMMERSVPTDPDSLALAKRPDQESR